MTRRQRLLRLARKRGDRLAIAVLEADRTFGPEYPDYTVLRLPRPHRRLVGLMRSVA